jgi:hypothetical protein
VDVVPTHISSDEWRVGRVGISLAGGNGVDLIYGSKCPASIHWARRLARELLLFMGVRPTSKAFLKITS